MITLLLLVAVVGPIFALTVFALGRLWTVEVAFVRLAWIPTAALAIELALFPRLAERMSYGAAAVPLLTALVSLFAAVMGMTLLASARERGGRHPSLRRVTWIAALPGIVLGLYVLYVFAGIALRAA